MACHVPHYNFMACYGFWHATSQWCALSMCCDVSIYHAISIRHGSIRTIYINGNSGQFQIRLDGHEKGPLCYVMACGTSHHDVVVEDSVIHDTFMSHEHVAQDTCCSTIPRQQEDSRLRKFGLNNFIFVFFMCSFGSLWSNLTWKLH